MIHNRMRPIHPGEILEEEFLKPLKLTGLTASSLANAIGVPPNQPIPRHNPTSLIFVLQPF